MYHVIVVNTRDTYSTVICIVFDVTTCIKLIMVQIQQAAHLRLLMRLLQALSMLVSCSAFIASSSSSLQHQSTIDLRYNNKNNNVICLSESAAASADNGYTISTDRRKELLARPQSYWKIDKVNNSVEFGSTISLTQQLNDNTGVESWNSIAEWLQDSEALAVSIWDPKYITILDKDLYRLQVMELRFVTLVIQPTVDVIMKTEYYENDITKPIFTVQSINFNPNIQLLPGMPAINADSLGIIIEVVGRMVPSKNGKSVTGTVTFTNSGKLPLALRLVPESILKTAAETINDTVSNFVIRSFQKGSQEKYNEFCKENNAINQKKRFVCT